jgi:hypothetical protein
LKQNNNFTQAAQADQTNLSPIPLFQPLEAVFAGSEPVDRCQTTPPAAATAAMRGGRRQNSPPNMTVAAAAASEAGPKTPYEVNNQNSRAPETMDTAVNKKVRNTNIQFQVNLTKSKSFKNKVKAKCGMRVFCRALGGLLQSEDSTGSKKHD